ncbi:hypothetical protein E3N88_28218 [Mikania micrantha]|uniref:Uncharacterized protein n=1 Tax=Mikania micrantha TaxID=192012 RepID=A0A5N6N025_9ASTR|nr:hypothetical protein E3N88_28218 [Mikania micrantha]
MLTLGQAKSQKYQLHQVFRDCGILDDTSEELVIVDAEALTPLAILATRLLHDGAEPVEQWVQGQFPDTSLEVKTFSEGAGIDTSDTIMNSKKKPEVLHVYSRRGKGGNYKRG